MEEHSQLKFRLSASHQIDLICIRPRGQDMKIKNGLFLQRCNIGYYCAQNVKGKLLCNLFFFNNLKRRIKQVIEIKKKKENYCKIAVILVILFFSKGEAIVLRS